MEMFLIGVMSAVITYIFSYSYLTRNQKRKFNKMFGNGLSDIAITCIVLISIGTNGVSIALLALGLGIGVSLSLRAGVTLYGIKDDSKEN